MSTASSSSPSTLVNSTPPHLTATTNPPSISTPLLLKSNISHRIDLLPTTRLIAPPNTAFSPTSIIPSLNPRAYHISTHPHLQITAFDEDIKYFTQWRNGCMRQVLSIFHDHQRYAGGIPQGRGLDDLGKESHVKSERAIVEWRDLEGIAGALSYNYHLFGNFFIMFGGRDIVGNVRIWFYHEQERTAHPTLTEIQLLAYLWIHNTPPLPTTPLQPPNTIALTNNTLPSTSPVLATSPAPAHTASPISAPLRSAVPKKRKRGREAATAKTVPDDHSRWHGDGGIIMGGDEGEDEGERGVRKTEGETVTGEWVIMNRS
ncbi:MAG: hypothetical protein Q9209_004929 [Squamulea sp. 1 TL-2023]